MQCRVLPCRVVRAAVSSARALHASFDARWPVGPLHPSQKTDEALVMAADKVNMELLNGAGAALNEAITNPFFGVL